MTTSRIRIQVRRDTAVNWNSSNPILAAGEIGFERDTNQFKIGTGLVTWSALSYAGGAGSGVTDHALLSNLGYAAAGHTGFAQSSHIHAWADVIKTGSSLSDLETKTHALLGSLTADDHTIYALLAGRAGGQTLYGGTGARENLTLYGTSHATPGSILIPQTGINLVLGAGLGYLSSVVVGTTINQDDFVIKRDMTSSPANAAGTRGSILHITDKSANTLDQNRDAVGILIDKVQDTTVNLTKDGYFIQCRTSEDGGSTYTSKWSVRQFDGAMMGGYSTNYLKLSDGNAVTISGIDYLNLQTNGVTRIQLINGNDIIISPVSHITKFRGSTNPQILEIYNTYTDASNYERAKIGWNSNVLEILTEASGTGSSRSMRIGSNPAGAMLYIDAYLDVLGSIKRQGGNNTLHLNNGAWSVSDLVYVGSASSQRYLTGDHSGLIVEANFYRNASGTNQGMKILTTYDFLVGHTTEDTDLLINRTETGLGTATHRMASFRVSNVEKFGVKNTGEILIAGNQVVGARVVDARIDDTINSGDATTDGVIDAIVDCLIAHGLIAAA